MSTGEGERPAMDESDRIGDRVNTSSRPSRLAITDMRFADIAAAPMHCTLMKLYTNQDLVGFGEIRDAGSRTYALMLKDRILGENPCNVDKLFRRIKQFGPRPAGRWGLRRRGGAVGPGRQGLRRSGLAASGRQIPRPDPRVLRHPAHGQRNGRGHGGGAHEAH